MATRRQLIEKNQAHNSRQNGEKKNSTRTTNSMTPWRRASLHSLVGEQGKPSAAISMIAHHQKKISAN